MDAVTLQDPNIDVKTYPIRVRDRGQITVPQAVRDRLKVAEGDMLILLQVDELILLTPKQPQVPKLADKIAAMMEKEDIIWLICYWAYKKNDLNTRDFTSEVAAQSGLIIQTPGDFVQEIREIVEQGLL